MRRWSVVAVVAVAAAVVGTSGTAASSPSVVAAVQLKPENGSGVRGAGFFRQRRQTLSGWVVVWGLPAASRHAVHWHAPGKCGGPAADAIAAHQDLVADAKGVAYTRFSLKVTKRVLKRGVYYNVHEKASNEGKSPSLACGDVRPEK